MLTGRLQNLDFVIPAQAGIVVVLSNMPLGYVLAEPAGDNQTTAIMHPAHCNFRLLPHHICAAATNLFYSAIKTTIATPRKNRNGSNTKSFLTLQSTHAPSRMPQHPRHLQPPLCRQPPHHHRQNLRSPDIATARIRNPNPAPQTQTAKPKAVPRDLIWGIDLTGKTDTNKNLHYLFGILDYGSRALLHLQVHHDKTSRTLIACINDVIRTHGKPKIIRTDNEAIFTSRLFRRGLKLLGIRHQLTDPGCPWQNGRDRTPVRHPKTKARPTHLSPLPQAGEGLGRG